MISKVSSRYANKNLLVDNHTAFGVTYLKPLMITTDFKSRI
jgi:hypothetical protein